MLTIYVPEQEFYDEELGEFAVFDSIKLKLEHSLVSLSKWESFHEKPFLNRSEKTDAEALSYIKMMIFSPEEFPENIVNRLSVSNHEMITEYIGAKMTATWFTKKNKVAGREIITSELIYYWMISYNIPMQCENWHLNRLLTLIEVCNTKNQPAKKKSRSEIADRNRQLNAQRKAALGTRG